MNARTRLMCALGMAVTATAAAPSTEKSYQEARLVLDAGIKAVGGLEALQGIKDLTRAGKGTAYNQGQSLLPEAPLTTRALEVTSYVDFAGRRNSTETRSVPTGGVTAHTRAVLAGESGFAYNLVTKVLTPSSPGALAAARTAMRRDPAIVLLTAHGRGETLRSLGEATLSGRQHQVITFADSDGTQITLSFDAASGLLTQFATLADHAVLGDALTETLLSDYREVPVGGARLRLPARVTARQAGEVVQELQFAEIEVNAGVADGLFEAPKDAIRIAPAGAGGGVVLTRLGEDAYLAAGGSHHSLLVAFKDHVVVVEGPLNDDRSLAVLAKAAETWPGKPVKYLVPTHYHFDHSGGLRTYIAKGVTILTTPGNQTFLERLAATPHTLRPDTLAKEPRKPAVETFTGKKVLTDGTRTLELYDIGPNPHVTEAVIAYLPKEKAVFQSDLLTIPVEGPFPPASPALLDFAAKIKSLGLAVETMVPGHGRLGTRADLDAALAVRAPQ